MSRERERRKEFEYRDCEVVLTHEKSMGGDWNWYWGIFDKEDGFEVASSFSCCNDTMQYMTKLMKEIIDNYREHPEEYE